MATSTSMPVTPLEPNSSYLETIARLSSKANVVATLLLQRRSSAVLQTTGNTSFFRASDAAAPISSTNSTLESSSTEDNQQEKGINQFAAHIMTYLNMGDGLLECLDTEKDLKLLRLRTRKHELVIVPDTNFVFVVLTDTSS